MILYKYVTPDRVDILENKKIRFTQPGSLNDPFETSPVINAIVDSDQIGDTIEGFFDLATSDQDEFSRLYEQTLEEVFEEHDIPEEYQSLVRQYSAKEALRLGKAIATPLMEAALSLEFDGVKREVPQLLQESLSSELGILSLAEKPDNLLMWSHYAGCHEGFLIGFDATHSFFDQRKSSKDLIRKLEKVQYSKTRPEFEGIDFNKPEAQQAEKIASTFFFTKSEHWEYEEEWRMVQSLEHADTEFEADGERICLFSVPEDAFSEIVVGARMNDERRDHLIDVIKSEVAFGHVDISQAAVDSKEFQLSITSVTDTR